MSNTALKVITNEAITDQRSLNTITAEIVTITKQTQLMILHSAIEIGRRLCEAKAQVPHGGWVEYLENEVDFSVSTANNFMRVYKEYSQAVALFAVPKDERESFVAENNIEGMSVAQLKKLIAERDKKLTNAENEKKAAADSITQLEGQIAALKEQSGKVSEEELKALQAKAEEEARAKAKAELDTVLAASAEETAKALEQQKQLEAQLKAAQDAAKIEADKAEEQKKLAELQAQLKKAQGGSKAEAEKAIAAEKKKVAELEEKLKKAKDAAKAAADKALAEEKKKAAALEEKLKKAEAEDAAAAAELKAAQARAAELEKKLKLANTNTTTFAVYFEDVQAGINKLNGLVLKMEKAEDKETAAKLKTALKTVLSAAVKKL